MFQKFVVAPVLGLQLQELLGGLFGLLGLLRLHVDRVSKFVVGELVGDLTRRYRCHLRFEVPEIGSSTLVVLSVDGELDLIEFEFVDFDRARLAVGVLLEEIFGGLDGAKSHFVLANQMLRNDEGHPVDDHAGLVDQELVTRLSVAIEIPSVELHTRCVPQKLKIVLPFGECLEEALDRLNVVALSFVDQSVNIPTKVRSEVFKERSLGKSSPLDRLVRVEEENTLKGLDFSTFRYLLE